MSTLTLVTLSRLVRDTSARLPGGRRLKAELDQSRRHCARLRARLDESERHCARLRTRLDQLRALNERHCARLRTRLDQLRALNERHRARLRTRLDQLKAKMQRSPSPKQAFDSALLRLRQRPDGARAAWQGRFSQVLLEETFEVETPRGPLKFVLLGRKSASRARSVLRKQPATIEWIESFRPDSVFWDVGANVGVYSLYAALHGGTRVVAFEPAAVNFFLLAANCEANRLETKVDCLLAGLGSEKAIGRLSVSQFSPAYSFSFHATQDRKDESQQCAFVLSMDQLVQEYRLQPPNYIKIDVDVPSVTEAIISGGAQILRRPEVRELHIEMREHSRTGQRIVEQLGQAGFEIVTRSPVRGALALGQGELGTTDLTFAKTGL